MEQDQTCCVCKERLSADVLKCDGVCNQMVHAKCIPITKTVFKALQESDNLMYICDDCNENSYKAINVKLNKILSFICIYDERVSRSEKNVSNLIEQISEIKTLISDKNDKSENIESVGTRKAKTYAEKVKMNNNVSVLLLKPKNTQNSDATECDLKKFIDPTKFNINNLRKFPKGGLAIECNNISQSKEVEMKG